MSAGLAGFTASWNHEAGASVAAEPATFEEFFVAERDRLFRTLCLVTGSRAEAEDLAQDAFVKVLERWDRVAAMDDPAGYLHRTAMNLFRNRYRRARRAARRLLPPRLPEDVFEPVERREAVDRVLASLSPRQRAAVVLVEGLGYPAEEAGAMLGVRGSTVRALLFQARSSFRERKPVDA